MAGYGQSLGQALGQFAFGGNTQDATMKGMLAGAQANQFDASAKKSLAEALKAEAEVRGLQMQEEARSPQNILRNTAQSFGIPSDDLQAVEQFTKTGALGGRFAPSVDGMGPVTPQPDWARQLPALVRSIGTTNRALTLGDKSVENAAKADSIGREMGLSDSVIAGKLNRNTVGGAQAAINGKPLFNSDSNGAVLDLFNGNLNESGGIAQGTIQVKKEQAGAQKANAVQSYASANNSNASAAKTNDERLRGAKGVLRDTDQGLVLVDPLSGKASAVTGADGKPLLGKPVAVKPMPNAAMKMQNEELDAIGTFSGINADLAGLEKQIKDGKLKFGLAGNVINQGRNFVGASTEESRNLASFKSKMESMRNAVLLLNKGVQTEGDAQRAMNEIFANINDQGVVTQRLAEIQALNKRAVELRKNNVGVLRRNYQQDDMDFAKFDNQPGATNLQPAQFDAEKERRYQEFKARQAK